MSPETAGAELRRGRRFPGRSRRGVLVRAVVAAVAAAVVALWAVLPFAHWTTTLSQLRFLIPWLLDPRTGFLPLALALFLLLTVPGLLRRFSGEPAAPHMVSAPHPVHGVLPAGAEGWDDGDTVYIPTAPLAELEAEDRWEMAQALGIPWRDELIHDDQSWTSECREAARARAAAAGGGDLSASGPGR